MHRHNSAACVDNTPIGNNKECCVVVVFETGMKWNVVMGFELFVRTVCVVVVVLYGLVEGNGMRCVLCGKRGQSLLLSCYCYLLPILQGEKWPRFGV